MSTGTSRRRASANASSHHGHQSTGLSLCCNRYGEVEPARRFVTKRRYSADYRLRASPRRSVRLILGSRLAPALGFGDWVVLDRGGAMEPLTADASVDARWAIREE